MTNVKKETVHELKPPNKNTLFTKINVMLNTCEHFMIRTEYIQLIFCKILIMLYYCRPILSLSKKKILKYLEKKIKNRPIIAIISIT